MADSKLADLTSGTAAATDIIYAVKDPAGTPLDRKIPLSSVKDYITGSPNTFTDNQTISGSLTINGGTLNGTVLDISQTWGGTGTYTGLKYNVVDSGPSNAASLLMDLQVGGSSRFSVSKTGSIRGYAADLNINPSDSGYPVNLNNNMLVYGTGGGFLVQLNAAAPFRFGSDLTLTRRGAANLRLGAADAAAPVAQTLSVQSVVAGTTNTAGANLTITGSQGTGTGAGGSIIFQVAPAGSSGTAQNGLADAMTIDSSRSVFMERYLRTRNNIFAILDDGNSSIQLSSTTGLGWTSSGAFGPTPDTILRRDAANTLALRNGANAQTFRVYNTTDGTNGEWLSVQFSSNLARIGTNSAGTGVARELLFGVGGGSQWALNTSGHLITYGSDNTYDIGASGGSRPRNVYVAGAISAGGPSLNSPATDVMRLYGATNGAALQLVEMTAPAAPGTNNVRIYAEDNGSGKTRLMALFATGAAVQIAIEP